MLIENPGKQFIAKYFHFFDSHAELNRHFAEGLILTEEGEVLVFFVREFAFSFRRPKR